VPRRFRRGLNLGLAVPQPDPLEVVALPSPLRGVLGPRSPVGNQRAVTRRSDKTWVGVRPRSPRAPGYLIRRVAPGIPMCDTHRPEPAGAQAARAGDPLGSPARCPRVRGPSETGTAARQWHARGSRLAVVSAAVCQRTVATTIRPPPMDPVPGLVALKRRQLPHVAGDLLGCLAELDPCPAHLAVRGDPATGQGFSGTSR
jgi:hypothetical protein